MICFKLFMLSVRNEASRTRCTPVSSSAMRTAPIAITTTTSIRVRAARWLRVLKIIGSPPSGQQSLESRAARELLLDVAEVITLVAHVILEGHHCPDIVVGVGIKTDDIGPSHFRPNQLR